MSVTLRRLRGVVGMAVLWGGAFAAIGATYFLWLSYRFPGRAYIDGREVTPPEWLVAVRGAIVFAPWGVLAGTCFALLLIAVTRRHSGWRRTDALPSLRGAAVRGALAAIALPLALGIAETLGIISAHGAAYWLSAWPLGTVAVAGGGLAAGLVAIAKRPLALRSAGSGSPVLPPASGMRG